VARIGHKGHSSPPFAKKWRIKSSRPNGQGYALFLQKHGGWSRRGRCEGNRRGGIGQKAKVFPECGATQNMALPFHSSPIEPEAGIKPLMTKRDLHPPADSLYVCPQNQRQRLGQRSLRWSKEFAFFWPELSCKIEGSDIDRMRGFKIESPSM